MRLPGRSAVLGQRAAQEAPRNQETDQDPFILSSLLEGEVCPRVLRWMVGMKESF